MSDIPKQDGTSNPRDNVIAYTTRIKGNDLMKPVIKSMLLKKFGVTLTKETLTQYSLLSKNSIKSFAETKTSSRHTSKHKNSKSKRKTSSRSNKETLSYSKNLLIGFGEKGCCYHRFLTIGKQQFLLRTSIADVLKPP